MVAESKWRAWHGGENIAKRHHGATGRCVPLAQAKRKEPLPTRREGTETAAAGKRKGKDSRQGCGRHPLCSAGLSIHAGFAGRGGEDRTLAGTERWAEGMQGGCGELEARGCPHLSILTSSWAPAKDKVVGVSDST